jgi:hypothetical protein
LTLESYDSARLVNGGDHETGSSLGGPTFGCKRLQTNDIEINVWTGFFILNRRKQIMHLELISSPRIQHNVWGIIIELLVNAVKEMRRLSFCITRAS